MFYKMFGLFNEPIMSRDTFTACVTVDSLTSLLFQIIVLSLVPACMKYYLDVLDEASRGFKVFLLSVANDLIM